MPLAAHQSKSVSDGDRISLSRVLQAAAPSDLQKRFLCGAPARVDFDRIAGGSVLRRPATELCGRSVLLYTSDQFDVALAMIALDGVARRLVLCPPDLPPEHLSHVIDLAEVDAIVADQPVPQAELRGVPHFPVEACGVAAAEFIQTEWILLTSGTTGLPKLVVHTLPSLAGAIPVTRRSSGVVWSTFYDIRRYGGLQIFLRAVLSGASLVLAGARESVADFLARAGACVITHISGTPSHWRRALMSPAATRISPHYVRLSGEIADQPILNRLQSTYAHAQVSHAFASTEAGLAFEVNDNLEGFPASLVGSSGAVEMKVEDDSLRIRSARIARGYLGGQPLTDSDGFVDTRDLLELRGSRYYFVGRRDGVINIGGSKVHPEEVEAVINRHPSVRMSLVHMRKNPIVGGVVVADIVLQSGIEPTRARKEEIEREILQLCRSELAARKVPASIKFVSALDVAETGKLKRTPCAT